MSSTALKEAIAEVEHLRAQTKAAEDRAHAIQQTEARMGKAAELKRLYNAPIKEFFYDGRDEVQESYGILPCREQFNPHDPANHEFGQEWLSGSVAYVLSRADRSRPTRVVISSGMLSSDWNVGSVHRIRHDQTMAILGTYEVVGMVLYDVYGEILRTIGEVPDRKIASAVFK